MSPYHYPAATPAQPSTAPGDPTAVMGRRAGAWVIDLLLFVLIASFLGPTPLSPLAEYVDTDAFPGVSCEAVREANDVYTCLEIGDRLYFTKDGDAVVALVAFVVATLLYVTVQGAVGVSPGKAMFGVRAVDEQGRAPGFGRSLARTVMWMVDLAPWCIPGLVAFVTGLTSVGHRRVGDMAAKTFVVGKAHTGPVVVPGLPTSAAGGGYAPPGQPWGAPPAGTPGGPPWGQPPHAPPPGGWRPQPPGASPTGVAPAPGRAPAGPAGRPDPPGSRPDRPSGGQRATQASGWAPPGEASPSPPAGTPASAARPSAAAPTRDAAPPTARAAPATPAAGAAPTPDRPTSAEAPSPRTAPSPAARASTATGGAAPGGYNPQWDAARGTYIVWEPNRGAWLGWDEAAQKWKPL